MSEPKTIKRLYIEWSEFKANVTFIKGPPESPLQASLLYSVPAQISDSVTLNPHPNVWNVLHASGFTTGNLNKYLRIIKLQDVVA